FEASNVEYIEFWLMDPYVDRNPSDHGGFLYFNLGDVSEDVLRDGYKEYENGLPTTASSLTPASTDPYLMSPWGRVSTIPAITNAFDNDPNTRSFQDIGLDGLNSAEEQQWFASYLNSVKKSCT